MLKSLFLNNPAEAFTVFVMHTSLTNEEIRGLSHFIEQNGHHLQEIKISHHYFEDAPLIKHYTKEMYFRILAYKFLPEDVEKVLYLDPDVLVINEIRSLYDTDITDYLYAAAYHDRVSVAQLNKLRLLPYDIYAYYNSGVLLMNVKLQREKIDEQEIFAFVERNKMRLILPDQDILNALYSKDIKDINEIHYNYDPRFYRYFKVASNGEYDMDYIMKHTRILHFCGKKKPWDKKYTGYFHALYKHYEKVANI